MEVLTEANGAAQSVANVFAGGWWTSNAPDQAPEDQAEDDASSTKIPPTTTTLPTFRIIDQDGDGDVDLDDVAALASSFFGSNTPKYPADSEAEVKAAGDGIFFFDQDGDGDIDLEDVAALASSLLNPFGSSEGKESRQN